MSISHLRSRQLLIILLSYGFIIRLLPAMINKEQITITYLAGILLGLALIPLIYKIGYFATKDRAAGLFGSALAAAIPLSGWKEISIQLQSVIGILVFFVTIYALMIINKEDTKVWKFLLLVPILFAFIHFSSLYLLPIILLYFIFLIAEQLDPSKRELFFGFSAIITILIITPILFGAAAIVDGTLKFHSIILHYFNINKLFTIAGTLPMAYGVYGAYVGIVLKKNKPALLFTAIVSGMFGIMLFSPENLSLKLTYMLLGLCCLGSISYKYGLDFMKRSPKIRPFRDLVISANFILVMLFGSIHWLQFVL